jgi:glycosyltransferase involved in cell wall biosynthesis
MGSYRFSPDVGGIETASALLATEFAALGQEVHVVTETAQSDRRTWPFEIVRRPTPGVLLKEAGWCDIFFQNNISLNSLWAKFLSRKPWVVTHQTWITRVNGKIGWRDRLKRILLRFATNVAISESIARDVSVECHRIGNPYQREVFKLLPDRQRSWSLVFLGRLVSDKGLDVLIKALAALRTAGVTPRLTVIGTGPEEVAMRELSIQCGVSDQIDFLGQRTGSDLAEALNDHEIMVVPSRWDEPFGIVALEGIACGCVVVGSENGGLREAIGPCGLTFPNGSVDDLATVLRKLLGDSELCSSLRSRRETHLTRFEARTIASEYLRVFEAVIR